jgi:flavin-dependent dehydrogenase
LTKFDVVVVGAGPAGIVAATVLARAGARVRIVDRAMFPREKLCGDTVNPGTLAILRRLSMAADIDTKGLRITGMLVTGEHGESIEGHYPHGLHGVSISRRNLDWLLLQHALKAGAVFDDGVAVRDAVVNNRHGRRIVEGVVTRSSGSTATIMAPVVIAADGRRSALALGLGLVRSPRRPRRWAVGMYFDHRGDRGVGEMHIRPHGYIGVAPLPEGITNICLVQPWNGGRHFVDPPSLVARVIAREPLLRDRFERSIAIRPPVVLGPLAIDVTGESIDGLILAGDAAGFIDPMTGDGLRFAVRGGELAAEGALRALSHGWTGIHSSLAVARRREFGGKWRFNRALRALVGSPAALRGAAVGARIAPAVVRALVARAGDCGLARAS